MSDDDEDEYKVEKILTHMSFDALFQKTLASKAKFNPSSVEEDRRKHSKYAYLVHWHGYEKIKERTWEPESNLKDCIKLKEYKEENGMPREHEKFEKYYGPSTWRKLMVAHDKVEGIQYLLTERELEGRRISKNEKHQERERARAVTKADNEEVKKKKQKREEKKSEESRSKESGSVERTELFVTASHKNHNETETRKLPKANGESSSKSHHNNNTHENVRSCFQSFTLTSSKFKKHSIAVPGITALDANTPRIQKKMNVHIPTDGAVNTNNLVAVSLEEPERTVFKSLPSNEPSCSSNPPIKLKLIKLPGGQYEQARPNRSIERTNSEISVYSLGSEESMEAEEKRNKELVLKHAVDNATRELNKITMQLKKFPKEVEVPRTVRPFPYAANLRKFRRYQSEGQLSDFFNRNTDLEIFSVNHQKEIIVQHGVPPCIIKKIQEEPIFIKKGASAVKQKKSEVYKNLAKENVIKINQAMHSFSFDKNFKKLMEELVIAYSKDDNIRFKAIFENKFPKEDKFDCHRFAAIVMIMATCDHWQWKKDEKLFSIVEADGNVTWGEIRQQQVLCSLNHRKCTWMRLFFELIPTNLRFIETTERFLTGCRSEDGPFRDDVYFHCMRYGAECQKRLFFEYNKPIGIQEDMEGDYSCDAMHLLCVQYGNLQRIASYISLGGLDINALATNPETKQVFRLLEYLMQWVEKNISNKNGVAIEHKKYYRHLLDMIRLTCESLDIFILAEMNQMIFRRMQGKWKVHMNITYPHILRCSPQNNISNGGDGNQVLSCLFYPECTGYKDGLETVVGSNDEHNIEVLRTRLNKFRRIVSEGKGRLFIALYRVKISFAANVESKFELPIFEMERSDESFKIDKLSILYQIELNDPNLVDFAMIEMKPLSSPGCRYFVVDDMKDEQLIVPGSAHIEITGEFDKPMTFVTQIFCLKKNIFRKN